MADFKCQVAAIRLEAIMEANQEKMDANVKEITE
jgi:hypothetical protein